MSSSQAVEPILTAAGGKAATLLAEAETRILDLAGSSEGVIAPFAYQSVAAGGKRLRPLLTVLSAGLAPQDPEAVVRAAAAVELVHAATLVHDDVLDRSDIRRGQPTVVSAAGRTMATAVGDLLFAKAFGELVTSGAEAVATLAAAGSDLARGELMQRADEWNLHVSEQRFLARCELKTARLFEAAASLGAQAGGLDPALPVAFGRSVGIAFQLLDDVLDVSGPPEITGKPRGADLLDGTVTLPLILATKIDPSLLDIDLRSLDTDSAAVVCDRIEETGALEIVRSRAVTLVNDASEIARQMDGWAIEAFVLVASTVVERNA